MSDLPTIPPIEPPGNRFRRLLSEAPEEDLEAQLEALSNDLPAASPVGDGVPGIEMPAEAVPSQPEQAGAEGTPSAPAPEDPPTDKPMEFVSLSTQVHLKPGGPGVQPPSEMEKTPSSAHRQRTPPPPLGPIPNPTGPAFRTPALGTQDMPLPRRVDEVDADATQVTPSAFQPISRPNRAASHPVPTKPQAIHRPQPAQAPAERYSAATRATGVTHTRGITRTMPARPRSLRVNLRQGIGCLLRMALIGGIVLVIVIILGGTFLLWEYYQIAATLPSINDLRQRASQFETTRIFDRNGNVLYEILDPTEGRRTYTPLERISPYLVAATIATEDKNFYSHPGFDLSAIARAFWQNYQGGETVSGASTITQQLARALLLLPEESGQRTYERKIREAILAAEITRRYSKDQILELYLNEFNYGNLAYGIEAAAETYFGTTADKLTLGQAAFLAGLPQAPSVYDVYTNRDVTLGRLQQVLRLMLDTSAEQGCIYVSNSQQPVCVDADAALAAYYELYAYQFHQPDVQMRYPHWVNFVRSLLESLFEAQTIYRSGFTVYTTLDPGLQDAAEQIVKAQVESLAGNNASDGALVAIRPKTGEILALVGSADFYNDEIDGQVNMALSPRQPGSAMKPLTYVAAFEKGWTPASLIWDVPTGFPPSGRPDDPMPPYEPVNYDGRFHGPVTVRSALANSYNIPAVKTLQFVGIYDDPNIAGEDGLIAFARRLGITSLTSDQYGLSLTLGGGEVSLLEMTGVYATFANLGARVPPYAITRILDSTGQVVYDYQPTTGAQVLRPEHAYLITSILADNEARTPAFGPDSVLNLPFAAAAKTGTTNDYRDNLTFGYTPDLAVGVWVGNADYTPMVNTSGLSGAAPIWAEFMKFAVPQITGGSPTPFFRPAGIIDRVVCSISGTEPSQWCPNQRSEIFAAAQPPLPKEQDLWKKVFFDTWTNLAASAACPTFNKEEMALNVTDPTALHWIMDTDPGRAWAQEMGFNQPFLVVPPRECRADDPRPVIEINSPTDEQTVTGNPVDIYARIDATGNYKGYTLDYGLGNAPVQWFRLAESDQPVRQTDRIYSWDVEDIPAGVVTLHLTLYSTVNTYAEVSWQVNLQVPTPTPTPTDTPIPTETPTLIPTATLTPVPTETPTPTPTPTDTEQPPR